MRFFEDESCGQCTPCRVGTEKAAVLMGGGRWDAALLRELSGRHGGCLDLRARPGRANPLLSILRFFPEELA